MRSDRRSDQRGLTLPRIAQVVPDLATFAVDDGFAYSIPDAISSITVGSIVRVPLGGRTIRGYVTAIHERDPGRELRPIKARSGDLAVFDERLLQTARWAAAHYVAPLSVVLAACAPPNLPRARDVGAAPAQERTEDRNPVSVSIAGRELMDSVAALVSARVSGGRNAVVVVPTAVESALATEALRARLGVNILQATSSLEDRSVTAAWSSMQQERGAILVGTREVALWPFPSLGVAVIVDDGRPAMKAKQTPTMHVRDVLRRRSAVERFELAIVGAVPSVEAFALDQRPRQPQGRAWPFVELVDRRAEPPGSGVLTDTAKAAISAVSQRRGRVFILAPRRGYAAAQACVRCGAVRRCPGCGGAVESTGPCPRCGTEIAGPCQQCAGTRYRPIGAGIGRIREEVARVLGTGSESITIGTERDLVGVTDQDLAVAVDLDGRMLSPNYRAAETALRVGARLASTLASGPGRRAVVQTSLPEHEVMQALLSGRPAPFLRSELERRESHGLPPSGEVIAVEIRGEASAALDDDVRAVCAGATVRGPAATDTGARWLLQGTNLRTTRTRLRAAVQRWRDTGFTVRVDADPVDL